MSEKSKNSQKKVPVYQQLRVRLIASFMVPVLCIIALGVISYQKASDGIISSYETSASQTVNMMNQYLTLALDTVRSSYKSYLNEDEVVKYFKGTYDTDTTTRTNMNKTYTKELQGKVNTDALISNIYLIADNQPSITSTASKTEGLYTAYTETPEGAIAKADKFNFYLFGNQSSANEILETDSSKYSLRLVRGFSNAKAMLLVDINRNVVADTLASIDVGEGGHAAFITFDGTEFYADGASATTDTIFTETDFYQTALASEETNGMEYVNWQGDTYLFLYSSLTGHNAMICALIPKATIIAQASDIQSITIIVVIFAVLVAAALGTIISGHINKNIYHILSQLTKVSGGDLTTSITSKAKDEFRLLAEGVNAMIVNMKNLITNVTTASNALTDSAGQVSSSAQTFIDTSRDIQNAIFEIEAGVSNLDENSADCMAQMDTLSGRIGDVTADTNEISTLTDATGISIEEGISSMQNLTQSAKQTSEMTQNVITAIETLSEKSRSIGQIVESINHIAQETNLLSLNASIEAARAGEAGRGFAVVASQIRELADQSASSAGQIQKIIDDIIHNTEEVVQIAQATEKTVSSQESAMQQTASSFHDMDTQIHSLMDSLSHIIQNVENMEQAKNATLNAVESISSVSEQTAAGSSNVHRTVSSQQDAIATLESAADNLQKKAGELSELLKQFTI
ncbi:MAG: methyl-accepting chemotaxis protein [Blautia sp.]|nr:methyl-accepting chemotaxis protein [Lachnoclostridium sp.]MCM1211119.1 methyl-accepting chemotaxis protein [Blautia sp.]